MNMKRVILLAVALLIVPLATVAEDEHEHGEHDAEVEMNIEEDELPRFGLALKEVASLSISKGLRLSGRIVPADGKLAHVRARYGGVVKEVRSKVGQRVGPDDVLAVMQNSQNLQTYPLSSAIAGTVIKRHATVGEAVSEEEVLFVVADLSEVSAELAVYKDDIDRVRVGQLARVSIGSGIDFREGEVTFFSPITEERSQSRLARIQLKNPDLHFSPGVFVSGTIVSDSVHVAKAVDLSAVQTIDGRETIFVREGESFEPRPVVLGVRDEKHAEVLSGLKEGERYATGNTFILKAELGKSEAEDED